MMSTQRSKNSILPHKIHKHSLMQLNMILQRNFQSQLISPSWRSKNQQYKQYKHSIQPMRRKFPWNNSSSSIETPLKCRFQTSKKSKH